MKKKHPIHFLVLLLPGLLYSQNTFNRRFDFGFPAAVLTGIIATDSCYYATGIIADSIPPYNTGSLFCRFSLDGQPQLVNTVESTSKTYETWHGGPVSISNSRFTAMGYTIDTIDQSLLIVYNDQGDSLWTKSIYHPDGPLTLFDLVETPSGFFLLHLIGSGANTQIYLVKTDLEGHTQWSKTYGASNRNEYPYSIADTGDGLVIGAIKSNDNITNNNYILQDYIFKIDYSGNLAWEYLSPSSELMGFSRMIMTEDNGFLVTSAIGRERPNNPNSSSVLWHNHVYKLNTSREKEWEVPIRDSLDALPGFNLLTSALELGDGTGYVVAGNIYEHSSGQGRLSGVIAKISPNGILLWKHYLRYGFDPFEQHYINDIDLSPDGGCILAGQVQDRGDPVKATFQQAWLLKVDEQGCLVPGCLQLSKAEEAPATAAMPQVLLWPNPVQEVLSVYCQAQSELQLEIWDMQGRMWRRCSSGLPQVSLALDVAELPAGQYVLRYRDEAGQMGSTPFVKGGM